MKRSKRKIINDPVHGFIAVNGDLFFQIIDSLWFQRLRRIKQLGLTHLVYPGALHTRFHHALGAMHLMQQAIDTLRGKGHCITSQEEEGALLAILLHDIGHGPFSHALEYAIIRETSHEDLSLRFMHRMNEELDGALETAISIFTGTTCKPYLHQLVSGQLDVDRLDYLKRDSFFTGVSEGVIGTERIIKMLNVVDGQLVVEQKGIYSVEKFLLARRLMYWQVYLHKTVVSAECMLKLVLKRAHDLVKEGENLFATPAFAPFLRGEISDVMASSPEGVNLFGRLDDFDVVSSMKAWMDHPDPVLSRLCTLLMTRNLFRCRMQTTPFSEEMMMEIRSGVMSEFGLNESQADCLVFSDSTSNSAYTPDFGPIKVLMKDGQVMDLHEVSDQLDFSFHSHMVVKHYLCYPKELG